MQKLYLICNAHIDPCWQWDLEEGIGSAISTFRCAVDFCEEYPALVFNHNEAILYQWIEEYEPELFAKIKKLIQQGRWHIMGGWYLQPDCNLTSGEFLVRQILKGREYFYIKFGAVPQTAMNVDSFGHSKGLVQILKKSGYDSYIFCRPFQKDMPLENDIFIWQGYDSSEIVGIRLYGIYNSLYGKACEKIENWIKDNPNQEAGCIFWGVGDHGGGPSRIDLDNIEDFSKKHKGELEIIHAYPEKYCKEALKNKEIYSVWDKGLNHWGVGCYTSMIRVKQMHQKLESEYLQTEKIAAYTEITKQIPYPKEKLDRALEAIMFVQFHDILPGTVIKKAEHTGLRKLNYSLEILNQIFIKCFFKLCESEKTAAKGSIPIFIYNPHPYRIDDVFECEFMLENMNTTGSFKNPVIYQNGQLISSQCEKEDSNYPMDWRKKVVFYAKLMPSQINRFDCFLEDIPSELTKKHMDVNGLAAAFLNPDKAEKYDTKDLKLPLKLPLGKPLYPCICTDQIFRVDGDYTTVEIDRKTGGINKIAVDNQCILSGDGIQAVVFEDTLDSWAADRKSFEKPLGKFELCSHESDNISNVQVVENGEIRTVIDARLNYKKSSMILIYKINKCLPMIEIEGQIDWQEEDRMLKLIIPHCLNDVQCLAQTVYGCEEVKQDNHEMYMHQWCGVFNSKYALTIINEGIYGFSCDKNSLKLSLVRSPAYAAHPSPSNAFKCAAEYRFVERMDQGTQAFRVYIYFGDSKEIRENIDVMAQIKNERPKVLSYFPCGKEDKKESFITLKGNSSIQMTAFKKAEDNNGYIIRLFEPLGRKEKTIIECPILNINAEVELQAFEIATYRCGKNRMDKVSLMEV